LRIRDLDYSYPPELIATRPPEERDGARLLVLDQQSHPDLVHSQVIDLAAHVPHGSLIVLNDTQVIAARLLGKKRGSGGKAEIFLVEVRETPEHPRRFLALGRSSKGLPPGTIVDIADLSATVVATEGDKIVVDLHSPEQLDLTELLRRYGQVPLPPYMKRPAEDADKSRYQTIFAKSPGAVAAPTAGLHLTQRVLQALEARGCTFAYVTLHVGLGTFQNVTVDDLDDHPMHAETYSISEAAAAEVREAKRSGRVVLAVGTTAVRALESAAAADPNGQVQAAHNAQTRLLIQPGYSFKVIDMLLTNFHLPQSTLLALVSAWMGTETILSAYRAAIDMRYRLFSYGDAMLLRPKREKRHD
jgi:S-adenosylmethionine:tRNA ribosyltransferase-isomerase